MGGHGAGIVDEDIEAAPILCGALDHLAAERLVGDVAWDRHRFDAGFLRMYFSSQDFILGYFQRPCGIEYSVSSHAQASHYRTQFRHDPSRALNGTRPGIFLA